MRLRPVGDDAEWEALLGMQPEAALYHTLPWLRFQERQLGFKLFSLVFEDGNTPVGVFPLFVARRGIFRISSSPRGVDTLFLGPLVPTERLPDLLDTYEGWAHRHGIAYTTIAFTKEIDADMASRRGYVCERHRNCLVDLGGGEEAVYGRLGRECRRRIRQAERLGVKLVEEDLMPHLDRYVALSAQVFAKSNLRTHVTRPILADLLGTLAAMGGLLSLRAEVEGRTAAMYVAAAHRKTVYALDTASDPALKRYSANNLMTWYALRWACRRGCEVFDFGGGNTPSIAAFKASFGACEALYSNIKKPHGVLASAAVFFADTVLRPYRIRRLRRSRKGSLQATVSPHFRTPAQAGKEPDAGEAEDTEDKRE